MSADAEFERRALALLEAALGEAEGDRRGWIEANCDDDETLRARVLHLLGSHERAGDRLATGAPDFEEAEIDPPDRIGSYRVVELLGQGGMGAVFKAQRDAGDFDHQVAIKLIRPGVMSEALVERFERERQILADLSHPHIARLYDGGTTEDGAPFFVMEYIEGVPITEWADNRHLALADRLAMLIQVCRAVGFAHQNLIVHRDLTPSNVLVTSEGTPKLIDFGIARPQEDEAAEGAKERATTQLSLTPGYAAPERYSGAPATTLTDIYSLGKLLDRLAGDDARDADLSTIIARATADDPADRYPSAGAMARDIERFLGDYPVEAREAGRRYIFGKFFARNRTPVVAGAAMLLLLIGAFAATIYAYSQAEQQRARAEARFADTRAIARSLMFDVYDEVSRVPGSVRARLLIADTAQRYLESLAADADADVDVRYEAARGHFRLAEVIGARTGGGNVGLTERAQRSYARSRALLERLHADYPARRDIQASLGQVIAVMADSALFSDGNFETAKANAVEARGLLEELPELDPDSAGALAMTYLHEGNALAWEGEPEPAGDVYRGGLELIANMPANLRAAADVRRARAELLRMMGAYHAYFQRPEEARRVLDESLAIHRAVAEASGYAPRDIYGLVTILQTVAQAAFAGGDIERADALATEAVARARQSIEEGPEDAGPKELFTVVAIFKGHILATRGRADEAVRLADEAIAMKRSLIRRSGNVVSGPMTLAVRLQEASEVYLLAGRRSRACPVMREAVGIMRDYQRTAELPIANRTNNLEPMLAALRDC
ncbi:MAG: protein kinase [Parasphingopyxis sp.]|nr:serine/threonine protein kinase [Sphingomonadales bacterium]